ncbi:metalloprotease [Lithohypha guttulata]|uniref:Metalloprotease n=1 Tax=Lithohypha guttulata TaxID=1690604 RepID=A0AAN7T1C5_9EURO|nr:metalloprotease [Lithohypha guttulata]
MASQVRTIADTLEKPELDDRSYKVIELPNRLQALLCSDPLTDKASASLNVNVGNFSDDDDMPGMAHAVEHLLFMGTEKYPVENEYSSYLSANSGYSNAYTAATQTNYFFECAASHESNEKIPNGTPNGTTKGPLYGALDRFAQFFVAPLFLAETLDRELRAVDSENKKNLQSDNWRLSQLAKSLSNPRHPHHHFSTGNLKTLKEIPESRGVQIRQEFIKFYEKHYSANRMKLVVLGKEPLDELESWVVGLFSNVKNKDLPENRWDGVQPLAKEQLQTEIFAKPVMESRALEISFPYQDEEGMYETKPSRYLSHLIGHEGPGSVLAYLKEQGLANSLSAGAHTICPGSAFMEIEVNLTPEGLTRYRDVVRIVFQYIGMMKAEPPIEWMFEEQKNMAEVEFRFRQKAPASRFTSGTSSVMQKPLPPQWLLSGSKLRKFDPKAIVHAMQFLREDNFRLMIVSQDFPGDWNQKEKWYGTDYKVEKISDDTIAEIRQALSTNKDRPAELHLPHKNEFIPTKLDVEKAEVKEPARAPRLLRNDEQVRLWWKKDDTFWVPKANVNILIRNPVAYDSPANHVKGALFANMVKDALQEYSYDADISGLNYGLMTLSTGLELNVHGYNDKLSVLLDKVLGTMRDLTFRQDRFDIIKERFAREYKNWGFRQPYMQIGDHTRYLVDEKRFITKEYAAELPHVTMEEVKSFAQQLLSQAHLEMLVHGNVYRDEAKKMAHMVETTLRPRVLPPSQFPTRRNILLPTGSNHVYKQPLDDPENVNHAIEYYLQVGSNWDYALNAKTQLLAQMTDEPSFDQLRTKEQLGYVVWSGLRPSATMIGYRVLIQSEREPEYLESRIEAFLVKFKKDLADMTQEDFDKHKKSLIARKLEKVKNLTTETNRLWNYIAGEAYNFFQIDTDVESIRKLSKQDMQDFFHQFIDPQSPTRAKLSVHLVAQKVAKLETSPADQKQQLAEMLSQYLTGQGAQVESAALQSSFSDIEVHDQAGVLAACKTSIGSALPENKRDEVLQGLEKALPQVFVGLKIQAPEKVEQLETALETPKAVVIEDVHRWKAGLQVSAGVVPVTDIKDFQDFESKL